MKLYDIETLRFRAPSASYNTRFSDRHVTASDNESFDNFFQHLLPYKFPGRVKEKSCWMKGVRKTRLLFRACVLLEHLTGELVGSACTTYIFFTRFRGCLANFIII